MKSKNPDTSKINWKRPLLAFSIIFFPIFFYTFIPSLQNNIILLSESDGNTGIISASAVSDNVPEQTQIAAANESSGNELEQVEIAANNVNDNKAEQVGIAAANDCATDQFGADRTDADSDSSVCTSYGCDKLAAAISPATCGTAQCGNYANPDTAVWMGSSCCGDDSVEVYSTDDQYSTFSISWAGGQTVCCSSNACVDNSGTCYASTTNSANYGSTDYLKCGLNGGGTDDCAFCYGAGGADGGAGWLDCDLSTWVSNWCNNADICGASGGVVCGETFDECVAGVTDCCGDDTTEIKIDDSGASGGTACCNAATDCVDTANACVDSDSDSSSYEAGSCGASGFYCVSGTPATNADNSLAECECEDTNNEWISSASGANTKCCGDDGAESWSSGADGTGCCCGGDQISDDTFCSSNNLWCIDGTYSSSDVYDTTSSGTTITGNDIVDGCDATAVANAYICDTSGNTGTADGVCVDNDGDGSGTTYSCDVNEICDDGTNYADDCEDCANGVECDSAVLSGGTPPQYVRDGMCLVTTNNCCASEVVSGEKGADWSESVDWAGADEACGCSGKAGQVCDATPEDGTLGADAGAAGICRDSVCDTSMVSLNCGATCGTDDFSDANFGPNCLGTGYDGWACDSNVGDFNGFDVDGICVAGNTNTCDASGEVAKSGSTYAANCARGYECDKTIGVGNYVTDGLCGEAGEDDADNDCLTGAACQDSEDSNHVNEGCECATAITDWDPYDSDVSDGAFSASGEGICIGTVADTTGESCKSGSNYYNDCTSCSDGDECDMDITDGAYSADGMCTDSGTCTAGALVAKSGSTYKAVCEAGYECDSGGGATYTRDGFCAQTSCATGALTFGETGTGVSGGSSGTSASGNEGDGCTGNEGEMCDSDASSGAIAAEGVCFDNTCKTTNVWCSCTGACSTSDLTDANCGASCPNGNACDSDVGGNGFEQDGVCKDNGGEDCDTSGHVAYDGSIYYADCSDIGDGDSGHACDATLTNGNFNQDGICTDGSTCTTSSSAYESDNVSASVNSLVAGCAVDGAPCISDVTAVSGTAADSDFNGICISGTCDTNEVAWNLATGWAAACTSVEGYYCEPQGAGDDNTTFDPEGYCVDNGAGTIICCGDDNGEDIASGETTGSADVGIDAECACSSGTDEEMCDDDATGTFASEGICAKDAVNAWDCDTNEVCDDTTDIRDDCAQCSDTDTCWSSADGSAFSTNKDGVCVGSNCCNDFANGTTSSNLDSCGSESQVCTSDTDTVYCDDISDARWDAGDTEETNKYRCDESETQCILCGNDNAEAAGSGSLAGTDGECEAGCGAPSACDDISQGALTGSTCCYAPISGNCASQTCRCSSATLEDDNNICCYHSSDYCSATGGCTNVTETCKDYCIDDNNGGDCAQTRADPTSQQTCYWTETCADSGCGYSNSGLMYADYCGYCNASGNQSGDYSPALSAACDSDSRCPNSGTRYWDETATRTDDCYGDNATTKINTENYQMGFACASQTAACGCDNGECDNDCVDSGYGTGECIDSSCSCNTVPTLSVITADDDITPVYNTINIVDCEITITDVDGYTDITSGGTVSGTIWHSSSSFGGLNDNDNHYTNSSCAEGANDGANEVIYTCGFNLQWYAKPGEWTCAINVSDVGGANATNSQDAITINSFVGIGAGNTLLFGSMGPGETTGEGSESELVVSNQGTVTADVAFTTAGDLSCDVGTIDDANIHYDTSSNAYASMCAIGTSCTATENNFDLRARNSGDGSDPSNTVYFMIHIPVGVSGTCSTTVTITQI